MRKKKISPSILVGVLNTKPRPKQPWFALLSIAAIPLDIIRLILKFLLYMFVILMISAIVVTGIMYVKIKPEYESYMADAKALVESTTVDTFRYNENTVIYDVTGKRLDALSKDSQTEYLEFVEIPMDVVNAFVAVENRTFWDDPGVDWKSMVRIAVNAVKSRGSEVHGASTITQQLARGAFLNNGVTLDRKFREMAIAVCLTEKYSKTQIMEFYCNNIYFGNGYYGIEAAAKGYFGKSAKDCSLSEIAYLCAIPNSPLFFDPYNDPEKAIGRRDHILDSMYACGFISEGRMQMAKAEAIEIKHRPFVSGNYASTYAIDCAIRYFMKLDGYDFIYHFDSQWEMSQYLEKYNAEYTKLWDELFRGGYQIYTSIDMELQESLQGMVDEYIEGLRTEELPDLQAALVYLKDGKAAAVIGGTSGPAFGFNRAYQAYRQPGSVIKPFVDYMPALMMGLNPESEVKNIDVNEALALQKEADKQGKIVDLKSLEGKPVTLKYALEQSLNGVAYILFDLVGAETALPYLEEMKCTKIVPEDYTLSASLGGLTYGVTPVEMAGAYNCIAQDGMYTEPTCIVRIVDRYGNEMDLEEDEPEEVYNGLACKQMIEMMKGVMETGTAAMLKWNEKTDVPAYVKTGTTNGQKDVWMAGFTCSESGESPRLEASDPAEAGRVESGEKNESGEENESGGLRVPAAERQGSLRDQSGEINNGVKVDASGESVQSEELKAESETEETAASNPEDETTEAASDEQNNVLVVWIGCDTPKTGAEAGLWGGTTAGQLWMDAMLQILGETPARSAGTLLSE